MEPIEPGSTPPQDPETGTTAQPDGFRPEFWRDVAEVKRGAVESINRPQVRQLATAVALLCTLVEDLAQRVEALESPKPCEGCGERAIGQMQGEEFAPAGHDPKPEGWAVMAKDALNRYGILPSKGR